jgi:Na+/proline symporter
LAAHPLDLLVVVSYALVMLVIGVYFYFKVERYSDYYDGGRTWGVWIVGCAVAATNIGAGNSMGSVAMAYRDGVSAVWYVTLQALAFIPFAYIAVHKIHPLTETTLAEYLESRYRPWLRPISAVALALATFAILPAQIVGGATVLTALIGLDYTTAFLLVGCTLILYSALGGLPSVTYGDVYQWGLMLGGFLIGVPIFLNAAGGLSHVLASVPESHGSWSSGATGTWNPPTIVAWLITVDSRHGCGAGPGGRVGTHQRRLPPARLSRHHPRATRHRRGDARRRHRCRPGAAPGRCPPARDGARDVCRQA